ncbi:hypothetical protein FA13DRAFT_1786264 [Coprinellus micaceus]|uniref:Uncharacterized protein n=1 Tax=Coprinellus micaceus TaxID=71717 RepID=A0A4Y7TWE2_COPMI|nr:hypothetical protein FA13DRAFT_1786264 [Coprinellus micaceus]
MRDDYGLPARIAVVSLLLRLLLYLVTPCNQKIENAAALVLKSTTADPSRHIQSVPTMHHVIPSNNKATHYLPLYSDQERFSCPTFPRDPSVELASPQKRDSIINIVNVAWDLSILALLEGLSRVITPLSSVYCDSANHIVKNHLLHSTRYTFIWMPATHFFGAASNCGASYAVVFNIATQLEYTSLALSYFLLRFAETYTPLNDYRRFKLINLAYKFSNGGVTGVLLFDCDIRHAYRATEKTASSNLDAHHALWQTFPVCIWNGASTTYTLNVSGTLNLDVVLVNREAAVRYVREYAARRALRSALRDLPPTPTYFVTINPAVDLQPSPL